MDNKIKEFIKFFKLNLYFYLYFIISILIFAIVLYFNDINIIVISFIVLIYLFLYYKFFSNGSLLLVIFSPLLLIISLISQINSLIFILIVILITDYFLGINILRIIELNFLEYYPTDVYDFKHVIEEKYNIYEMRYKKKDLSFLGFDIEEKIIIKNRTSYGAINEENYTLLILPPQKKLHIFTTKDYLFLLLVYKKENNFFVKKIRVKNIFFNKNKKNDILSKKLSNSPFDTMSCIRNHFYLDSYLNNIMIGINKKRKIFIEGNHGIGKTSLLEKFLEQEKVFVSVEGENIYATPIHIIYDKIKQNLGFFRTLFIKFFCSFRLNIIPFIGSISLLILIYNIKLDSSASSLFNEIYNYLNKYTHNHFYTVILIALIPYFLISFFYYDIIIHIKNTTKINRNEFFRFINLSCFFYNIGIIIEDLDRIDDYNDWKSEIIYLSKNLKHGKLIVSYTNKTNSNQVFDNDEIKKHFDIDVKYYNQIYLYCNILYGKYKDLSLLKINSFRELKKKINFGSTIYKEEKELLKNPNYVLYKFIETNDEEKLFETMDYFKECIKKLIFDHSENIHSDVIIFLSIIFLPYYNKNLMWLNPNDFEEKIKNILNLCEKYYYEINPNIKNKNIYKNDEVFKSIIYKNLEQHAKSIGLINI